MRTKVCTYVLPNLDWPLWGYKAKNPFCKSRKFLLSNEGDFFDDYFLNYFVLCLERKGSQITIETTDFFREKSIVDS